MTLYEALERLAGAMGESWDNPQLGRACIELVEALQKQAYPDSKAQSWASDTVYMEDFEGGWRATADKVCEMANARTKGERYELARKFEWIAAVFARGPEQTEGIYKLAGLIRSGSAQ